MRDSFERPRRVPRRVRSRTCDPASTGRRPAGLHCPFPPRKTPMAPRGGCTSLEGMAGGAPAFAREFRSAASGVRRALAARRLLDGAIAGAAAAAVLSAVLWVLGKGHPVWAGAAALLAGIAGGALVARRARFDDAN